LANVATGVVALDRDLNVTIANPRAAELLGAALPAGESVSLLTADAWQPVWTWVRAFLNDGDELASEEFEVRGRRIRAQAAALHAEPRGCVVALDDTTEIARAVRVLAWGELARQVAHEIKNPLTPIRLGIQHIQRTRRDGSADFDATLERTSRQILAEIERLDAIARAFSRFGAPPAETAPPVLTDLAQVSRDTADLYAVGEAPLVRVEAVGPVEAMVRRDEVKEVLVNLIENARDAGARTVIITVVRDGGRVRMTVEDDGRGIPPQNLERLFEPQFSTTSSGTGLGLAISKRLVEGWGGTITVRSTPNVGTAVSIELEA
jgi:nitrogen fixation/metabolism regulation signal transduction histidine kinase